MRVALPAVHWGTGDRRVLLVHGLMSSGRVWWRVASELADRGWAVTAVDLRGHGSAPPAMRYPIEEMATDLVSFGGPWEVVVGHSVGGALAPVAGLHPGWANRLVLVDPLLMIDSATRAELEEGLIGELAATPAQLEAAHPDWHPDDVFWKIWSARRCTPWTVRQVLADNDPWDVSPALREVPVPCTVLVADPGQGALVEAGLVREIALDNPRIHHIQLAGIGHSVFRQRPDVVVQAVEG